MTTRPQDLAAAMRARRAAARSADRALGLAVRARLDAFLGTWPLPAEAAVWLFGSLASGDFQAASDVDLGVAGLALEQALAFGVAAERALGRPVDVLRLEALGADFATHIRADGVRLR